MLRNRKGISIIMTLCLCIALVAPVFVAPQAALAESTYSVLSTPVLTANSATGQDLGIIQVNLPSCAAVKAGDVLTLSLPSEVTMVAAGAVTPTLAAAPAGKAATVATATQVEVFVPTNIDTTITNGLTVAMAGATAAVTSTKTSLDITFGANGGVTAGRLYIYVYGATIGSVEGDITARMLAPANSAFTSGSVVVGKATTATGTTVNTVLSVKTIGSGGGACDIISVTESAPNTLKAGEIVKVKLPNGFTWAAAGAGTQSWGWAGIAPTVARDANDPRILNVTVNDDGVAGNTTSFPSTVGNLSGRVNFAAAIVVDDAVAKTGEISARIYSKNGAVTESDLVIANYGSFGVKVTEGTKKDLIAGKYDQKIGEFFIAEDIADSLIVGRSIKISLPKGAKWSGDYSPTAAGVPAVFTAESGTVTLGANSFVDSYATLKTSVAVAGTKSKFKFKDLKVDLAPDFNGPLTLTIGGTAGASGEVVVANVKPAVELSATDATKVRIGEQNQLLGTLIIKETAKENIVLRSAAVDVWDNAAVSPDIAAAAGNITVTLPGDAEWSAGFPTVTVTEGDLVLKTAEMSKAGRVLTIPVKSTGNKPSTIKISDMKATIYRTVPEGDFKVAVAGTAINETGGTGYAFPQFEDNKVAVASCVTPAPGEGTIGAATGQFKLSSNIYQVNGVAKVMDAAPYVKNDRTYVPVRFLGYALGLTDADIVYDSASQKATFTKGDKKVELTVGSTTITVNGEAKVMDVAPEISGDRMMLPARYVAEGMGFQVGWDAGTGTVLISK